MGLFGNGNLLSQKKKVRSVFEMHGDVMIPFPVGRFSDVQVDGVSMNGGFTVLDDQIGRLRKGR